MYKADRKNNKKLGWMGDNTYEYHKEKVWNDRR